MLAASHAGSAAPLRSTVHSAGRVFDRLALDCCIQLFDSVVELGEGFKRRMVARVFGVVTLTDGIGLYVTGIHSVRDRICPRFVMSFGWRIRHRIAIRGK